MGLKERRAVTEFKDKNFPAIKKTIDDAAGFSVSMDVRWNTLENEYAATNAVEVYQNTYFKPLLAAIQAVAGDDMGKTALKSGLKQVIVDGSSGSSANSFTFDNGILTILHEPGTNESDVEQRTK